MRRAAALHFRIFCPRKPSAVAAEYRRAGRKAGAIPDLRPRSLYRRRRGPLFLYHRCLYRLDELSLQRWLSWLAATNPWQELSAELSQGGGRRLQRLGDVLRLRQARSDPQGLLADAARFVQRPQRDAGKPAAPHSLSRGFVYGPGRNVRHLPHDRSDDLLQSGGSLGGAA